MNGRSHSSQHGSILMPYCAYLRIIDSRQRPASTFHSWN